MIPTGGLDRPGQPVVCRWGVSALNDVTARELPVFAYGTLKQGFRNHAAYCRGAVDVIPAETWGRLYVWKKGIPILEVVDEDILLTGTRNLATDLTMAEEVMAAGPTPARRPVGKGWRRIQGEVLVFPDAEDRLRLLDAFEGVHPPTAKETYARVLCRVHLHESRRGVGTDAAAWAYVLPPFADKPAERLDTERWQPELDA